MRFTRALRILLLAAYLCFVLLIALRKPYEYGNVVEPSSDDDDFDDNVSIFGYVPTDRPRPNKDGRKIIFVWSGAEIGPQHLNGCPDYQCVITSQQKALNDSDAVVFHNSVGMAPKFRTPEQLYVFFTQESPLNMNFGDYYDHDFFNWTLGYRRDADVPCPYGYVVKRKRPLSSLTKNLARMIARKDRPVAWFVSNCGAASGRDAYASELKRYIDVDVYGACGTMRCEKSNDCNGLLERRYKFYLAFENSLCKDYATEKFWEKMTLNIVVIVLKRSIVADQAPPDSFIAADDFDSPKSLAAYLKRLDGDPALYAQRFEWRLKYTAVFLNGRDHDELERPWCFCKLCRRLWEEPVRSKSYADLSDWWVKEARCDGNLVGKLIKGNKSLH